MKRIIIIGYMGSGKTTLGRALAASLGLPFYDLDWYIENRMRRKIRDLFAERGEEGFRTIEYNMLHEVAEFENVVISCGGGTPCFFDNMEYLNAQGDTIYLKTTPDVIFTHLNMSKNVRPLMEGKGEDEVRSTIAEQLEARKPYYEKAKMTLDISLLDTKEKINHAVDQLREMLNI